MNRAASSVMKLTRVRRLFVLFAGIVTLFCSRSRLPMRKFPASPIRMPDEARSEIKARVPGSEFRIRLLSSSRVGIRSTETSILAGS